MEPTWTELRITELQSVRSVIDSSLDVACVIHSSVDVVFYAKKKRTKKQKKIE
jgi:hypothetical protein